MSSRLAIVKYNSRVKRALQMKQAEDLWIVVGRTSPWADESNPDVPLPDDNTVQEPVVAIKAVVKTLAKSITAEDYALVTDGSAVMVTIGGSLAYLQFVPDASAYTEGARFLFLSVMYDPIILGHPACETFRVYYVVSGLVPAAGYENASFLEPINVADYGLVEYENAGTKLTGTTAVSIPVVLEFR